MTQIPLKPANTSFVAQKPTIGQTFTNLFNSVKDGLITNKAVNTAERQTNKFMIYGVIVLIAYFIFKK